MIRLIIALLFSGTLFAQQVIQGPTRKPLGVAFVYLLGPERFEAAGGSGYDVSGWVAFGDTAPDPNDTIAPLQGAQSLKLTDSGVNAAITNSFAASSNAFFRWDIMVPTWKTSTREGPYLFGDATLGAKVRLDGDSTQNRFLLYNGTVFSGGTLGDLATNVTYHCLLEYDKGTGANGISRLWWTTNTPDWSGAANLNVTTGDATVNVNNVRVEQEQDYERWDDVRISATKPPD